jgi:hypothetical protein
LDEVLVLDEDHITRFDLAPGAPRPSELLPLLRVRPGDSVDDEFWPSGARDDWVLDDEAFEQHHLEPRLLWVQLGDWHVHALETTDGVEALVPVDSSGSELLLDRLAESSWFSEAGGAPISWDGGDAIDRVSDDCVLLHTWGDVDRRESELFVWPAEAEGQADFVARWVVDIDSQVAAALSRHEFDPDGLLADSEDDTDEEDPDEDRRPWSERVTSLSFTFGIYLDEAVVDAVHERLASDHLYARTVEALRNPLGDLGKAFRTALQLALDSA